MASIIRGIRNIAREMGVCAKVVRRWAREGAPVAYERDGAGRPIMWTADIAALQAWRVARTRKENANA